MQNQVGADQQTKPKRLDPMKDKKNNRNACRPNRKGECYITVKLKRKIEGL